MCEYDTLTCILAPSQTHPSFLVFLAGVGLPDVESVESWKPKPFLKITWIFPFGECIQLKMCLAIMCKCPLEDVNHLWASIEQISQYLYIFTCFTCGHSHMKNYEVDVSLYRQCYVSLQCCEYTVDKRGVDPDLWLLLPYSSVPGSNNAQLFSVAARHYLQACMIHTGWVGEFDWVFDKLWLQVKTVLYMACVLPNNADGVTLTEQPKEISKTPPWKLMALIHLI